MPLTYLLHSTLGLGYRKSAGRVRRVQRALERLFPGEEFVRAVGCTPEDALDQEPLPERLATLERRMILGDARRCSARTATTCLPRVDRVLVVASGRDTVESEALAAQAGVLVQRLDEREAASLYLAGTRSEGVVLGGREKADERAPWPHPAAVIRAFVEGADSVLGLRAIPLPSGDGGGGGGRLAGKQRVERVGLRLASAAGIIREASADPRWKPETGAVLVAVYGWGVSYQQAADAAGLRWASDAMRRDRWALAAIREVLDRRAALSVAVDPED